MSSPESFLDQISAPIDDPQFFPQVFSLMCKQRKEGQARDGDNLKRVCAEEYGELSRQIDKTGVQESCAVRNVLRTRRFANLLITDKGELNLTALNGLILNMTQHLYSLGPDRQHDSLRHEHILKVLIALRDNPELTRCLKQIGRPHAHPMAEQIIRDTLLLPVNTLIQDAHARRAALSALLCYLRQNIGSCFATAPAIITHDEQMELFLLDLNEILATGNLKRTFGGVEYSVPISVSWGAGDLRRPLSLFYEAEEGHIWTSPGLILALEAVSLIEKEMSLREKMDRTKTMVLQVFPEWNERHPFLLTSISEILQRILLQHLGITKADLQAYEERPKGTIHPSLLIQPIVTSRGGKGDACAQYPFLLDRASHTFKALADNALLKAWEYTVASFAETKSEFTRWNLYASLGLGPEEPGGIGECLYNIIKHKLDQYNQKVHDLQFDYERQYEQVKQLESRLRHASSEKEAQWVRVEYQSKANEFYTLEQMRNEAHAKADFFANLFSLLIDQYDGLFPQYFQEVYDPELHEVKTSIFDDSPAGFRLLYKHGRANTSQWTRVYNAQEFIDVLANFFTVTEVQLLEPHLRESMQEDLSDIVTAIITHIRTPEFLETAFHRMAAAHKTAPIANPLENLEKIPMKPWAYISGGTMNTLVRSYHRREQKLTELTRWVENPMELLVFLVEVLKQNPHRQMEEFNVHPKKSLLMHSPTHAFLLKPGMPPFKETWQEEKFTYTWIRDTMIRPMENFVSQIQLTEDMQRYLIEFLSQKIPINYRHYFQKVFSNMHEDVTPFYFRDYILDRAAQERGLQSAGEPVISADEIDSALFLCLPFFPSYQLEEKLKDIWHQMKLPLQLTTQLSHISSLIAAKRTLHSVIPAYILRYIANAILCLTCGTTSSVNFYAQLCSALEELKFSLPKPLLFADTNWTKELFAFLVNPGTGVLDLWRVDPSGKQGSPMSSWKEWLNGSQKEMKWGVYPHAYEYTSDLISNKISGRMMKGLT